MVTTGSPKNGQEKDDIFTLIRINTPGRQKKDNLFMLIRNSTRSPGRQKRQWFYADSESGDGHVTSDRGRPRDFIERPSKQLGREDGHATWKRGSALSGDPDCSSSTPVRPTTPKTTTTAWTFLATTKKFVRRFNVVNVAIINSFKVAGFERSTISTISTSRS